MNESFRYRENTFPDNVSMFPPFFILGVWLCDESLFVPFSINYFKCFYNKTNNVPTHIYTHSNILATFRSAFLGSSP